MVLPFASPPPTFPLGVINPRVFFIIAPPPGQCLSKCWSKLEPFAAPPQGNLRSGFSCTDCSSGVALRTRYVQLLSGFVGTFGRCCWFSFTLSKCLVVPGYRVLSERLGWRSIPSLTVRACDGLSWDTLQGFELSKAVPAVMGRWEFVNVRL